MQTRTKISADNQWPDLYEVRSVWPWLAWWPWAEVYYMAIDLASHSMTTGSTKEEAIARLRTVLWLREGAGGRAAKMVPADDAHA